MKYDNILNNFEFEGFRAKVKVTVAIFLKTLSLISSCGPILLQLHTMFSIKISSSNASSLGLKNGRQSRADRFSLGVSHREIVSIGILCSGRHKAITTVQTAVETFSKQTGSSTEPKQSLEMV